MKNQKISIIKKALLIEDYILCQKFMRAYLQKLNYHVDVIDDYCKALNYINTRPYDLIILDINLYGNLTGEKITQKIHESSLNIGTPIILWSAYFDNNDEQKYLMWGVDAALIKACDIKDLEKTIHKCFLTPRYEREFHYKLKLLQKKWQENGPMDWVKKINDLRSLPFSILEEGVQLIKEYQNWSTFHKK